MSIFPCFEWQLPMEKQDKSIFVPPKKMSYLIGILYIFYPVQGEKKFSKS